MGIFEGVVVALDLGYNMSFKSKVEVKKKILDNGGTISYIVSRQCHFVVTGDEARCGMSSKCAMAVKYRLPVLSVTFIWDSLKSHQLLPFDQYVVGGKSKILDFRNGKVSAPKQHKIQNKYSTYSFFNPRSVKLFKVSEAAETWTYEDTYQVAKYAIFLGHKSGVKCHNLTVIELHAPPAKSLEPSSSQTVTRSTYRIMLQTGSINDSDAGRQPCTEICYTATTEQALAIFAWLYEETEKKPNLIKMTHPVRAVGSKRLQKLMAEMVDVNGSCDKEVKELVEHIWSEAMSEVTSLLARDTSTIKMEQVEKAEGLLLRVRDLITSLSSDWEVQTLIDQFYQILPHKKESSVVAAEDRKRWLIRKQDMCQLVRDVLSASEVTNYETRDFVEAKSAALRCKIRLLTEEERNHVEEMITSSMQGEKADLKSTQDLTILNVYEVWRPLEDIYFRHDMEGKQFLFHSSKVENFVGILSRGLLLPKVVVDDFGGKRSDAGMLGSGIYFASSVSTSLKFSSPSSAKGSRLLLINEVALGHIKDYLTFDTSLVVPPTGYDSTHGVSKKQNSTSQFQEDEFVVYSANQQRVRYLVEFVMKGDKVRSVEIIPASVKNAVQDTTEAIGINDVTSLTDPLTKVQPGLVCPGGKVQLKAAHVRAKLLDLAVQVIVLQEYVNNSTQAIEAKYVFPLEDTAVVCGFEAFIDGKHIVGQVKEKELAHHEYKKAISQGHGAYLMDQEEESPDVFTVSIGNLLPLARVLIKISYVAELQVEDQQISFLLPATVAPWKKEAAFKHTTQSELESFKMVASHTTVQVAVEMPFDIRKLYSPTHQIRLKQTASKACVEMLSHQDLGSGFQLLIGLSEAHVPRMWVERHPDHTDHQACMLTFYPEFELSEAVEGEIIILIDASNSMRGSSLTAAKKVALLLLKSLPQGWHFNLVTFGSDYEELFPAPQKRTDDNKQTQSAINFIQKTVANKGNTDMLWPLRSLCLLPLTDSQRNVFLISDGHISHNDLTLDCAKQNSEHARVFTFGVGETCNSYFLKALSRVSGGAFEYFNLNVRSKWELKVQSQLDKASQPALTSVSVEWHQHEENLPVPVQAPQEITSLFNGSRQVIYGFVPNCTMATLKASFDGQEVSTLVSTSELSITQGLLVHSLTARALIRDWEDGMLSMDRTKHEAKKMDMKNFIIDLSKDYSIVTQFTSFIAVEKRDQDDKYIRQREGPSIEELVDKENVDILPYMAWSQVPEDSPLTILASAQGVSQSVKLHGKTERLFIELENIQKAYKKLREKKGPFSGEVLKVALALTEALSNVGHTEEACAVCREAYNEAVEDIDRVLEHTHFSELADFLVSIRERSKSLQEDVMTRWTCIPFPKLGSGKLLLKTLNSTVHDVYCHSSQSISQFKELVQACTGIPVDSQRLILCGRQLEDDKRLADYNVNYGDTIYLVQRLRGGGEVISQTAEPSKTSILNQEWTLVNFMKPSDDDEGCEDTENDDMGFALFDGDEDVAVDIQNDQESEDTEDEDMGFALFDGEEDVAVSIHDNVQANEDTEDDEMGFGCFDEDEDVAFDIQNDYLESELSEDDDDDDFALCDGDEDVADEQSSVLFTDHLPAMKPDFPNNKESSFLTEPVQSHTQVQSTQPADQIIKERHVEPVDQMVQDRHIEAVGQMVQDRHIEAVGQMVQDRHIEHVGGMPQDRHTKPNLQNKEPAPTYNPGDMSTDFSNSSSTYYSIYTPMCSLAYSPMSLNYTQSAYTPAYIPVSPSYASCSASPPAPNPQPSTSQTLKFRKSNASSLALKPKILKNKFLGPPVTLCVPTDENNAVIYGKTPLPLRNAPIDFSVFNTTPVPRLAQSSSSLSSCDAAYKMSDPSRSLFTISVDSSYLNSRSVRCIRTKGKLLLADLDQLLELQTQQGAWELDPRLDKPLGIRTDLCVDILLSTGLNSLGKAAVGRIKLMVATLVVLLSLVELLMPDYLPVDKLGAVKQALSGVSFQAIAQRFLLTYQSPADRLEKIRVAMLSAIEFCDMVECLHPLVYSTLELGSSWEAVTSALLQQPHSRTGVW